MTHFSKQSPTTLYNGLLNPIIGYCMRGVIWYQGEANRDDPYHYDELMRGLVSSWRELWEDEFPFYFAQLAPYKSNRKNAAFLREAQLKAAMEIPGTGMACLLDIGEENCIHPSNKLEVGNRLAYIALAKTYQVEGIPHAGPLLNNYKIDGDKIYLTFNNAEGGLTSFGKELSCFTIAGKDGKFYSAHAEFTKEGIIVYSNHVNDPVAVRYGFTDFVKGDLYNTAGLPASSFRTDNWDH